MPIKILSQKPILDADLFSVVETTLDINGTTHVHRNIYRPSVASIFPLSDDGELYLIRQYRYLHGETFLEEIAGHIEKNENPVEAAKRELREEAGLSAENWSEFGTYVGMSSVVKTRIHMFLARDITVGTASPEEDEAIEAVKMSLDEALESVLSGKVKNSIASLGILLLHTMRERGEL